MTEKTEKPTPKKIRKSREEGQVAHSKDITQVILFAAVFGYLIADATAIGRRMGEMMVLPGLVLGMEFEAALRVLTVQFLRDGVRLLLPFLLIVIALGFVAEMTQTRMLFAVKAIKPSARKLNVIQNVKNIFGAKGWFEFFKSVLKIVILSAVVVVTLHGAMAELITLPLAGLHGVGVALQNLLTAVIVKVVVVYAFIALADWVWQHRYHRKQLMMSIDEVRRESKEDEGDPHLKRERRSLHRSMLESQALEQARSASVLVTNPIHLAIALQYKAGVTPLPLVTAMGEGALAASMVEAAREAGVPVMENVPLAWELRRRASIEHYIPVELIEPVAEVLRMVRRDRAQGDFG